MQISNYWTDCKGSKIPRIFSWKTLPSSTDWVIPLLWKSFTSVLSFDYYGVYSESRILPPTPLFCYQKFGIISSPPSMKVGVQLYHLDCCWKNISRPSVWTIISAKTNKLSSFSCQIMVNPKLNLKGKSILIFLYLKLLDKHGFLILTLNL